VSVPAQIRAGRRFALLVLAATASVLALMPSPALAHATLVSSTPRQAERLAQLPDEVTFEFNQDISAPAYVIVTAPDDSSVTAGAPDVEARVVTQSLTDGPDGTYTMAYRAVSEDGQPVTGEITFTVGAADNAATPAPSSAASSAASPSPAASAARKPDDRAGAASVQIDGPFARRHAVAIGVGGVLFAAALFPLVMARRTEP
jgi:copper resistance protein C